MEKMTLKEIEARNHSESGEVLIVFKGNVYDVSGSPMWKTGLHMKRHKAGEDLTQSIQAAPHGEDVLGKFPIVAEFVSEKSPLKQHGWLLNQILNLHPHPVSVHFPIALIMTASFLTVLGWLLSSNACLNAGYTNLLLGTLAAPVAFGTGFMSFHFNYGHKWTRTFRMKQILSICFFSIAVTAVIVRFIAPGEVTDPGFMQTAYLVLLLILPTLVGATGYLGGTITFPRN